jgi:hypothetical protein
LSISPALKPNASTITSTNRSTIWFVYENWRSRAGLDVPMRAPHLHAFLKAAPDLLADDIDLRQFSMVSASAAPRAFPSSHSSRKIACPSQEKTSSSPAPRATLAPRSPDV